MPKSRDRIFGDQLVEAAHMVEADKDEAAFEKRLKKIAKAKPKPKKPKRKGS